MQEKDTYIEPFEPLWVRSKYSLMGPQVATADIHNLHYQAARHGYNYLAISDPNIYGLAESVDAAQEYNLKHIIAATIPFQASAIHLQTINLIAKNNSGVRQVFGAINEAHHQGVVSPEYLYPVLESGDTFGLFEWQETHIFHRDFLKLSHAFLAFTYPSPSAKAAAHQLIKRYPHNLIITHDVRMATPTEAPLLQFLSAAYPEKATDLHRQQLLNYILPSPLAVN